MGIKSRRSLWLLIGEAPRDSAGRRRLLVRCACGVEKTVDAYTFRSGRSRGCISCGNTTHGLHGSPTYKTWEGMVQRTTNDQHPRWDDYGGRGITIDPRWLTFENFLEDMGLRPPDRTLDRKENDLGYSKENCRWATRSQQTQNTRRSRRGN